MVPAIGSAPRRGPPDPDMTKSRLDSLRRLSLRLQSRLGQAFSLVGGLLFVGVVWALVFYHLQHARTETIHQAEGDAINLSVAMSEQVARLVEGADSVMRMIGTAYAADPKAFDFAQWAAAATGLHDAAMQVSLFDASGDLLAMRSRNGSTLPKVNVADRAYFKALSSAPGAGLYVGRTLKARMTGGGYAFQLARRLELHDGTFGGVLVVSLDPQYLSDRFDDLDIGKDGSVALFGLDGFLRARHPAVPEMFERDLPQSVNQHIMFKSLAGAVKGSFQTKSAYDGVSRIYGYKALDGLPLVVSIGMSRETVMAPYRAERQRSLLLGFGATLGAVLFVLASLVEIEHRRKRMGALAEAHAAAAAAEARYRLLAENTTDMIVRLDPDARRSYVSPACHDLLGRTPEAFAAMPPMGGIHPDDVGGITAMVASLGSGERDNAVRTYRVAHADGHWVWVEGSWRALRDAHDTCVGFVASVRDVHERQTAAEALLASTKALEDKTALLELAQSAAGAGTWDYDFARDECLLSPDSARLHGLPEVETLLPPKEWATLCVADDGERTMAAIRDAVSERRTMRSEFRVVHPDGSVRWVMAIGRATYDEAGKPVRMIGLNLDITIRKETETALILAKAEAEAARVVAERASAAKSDFLATMSHEVRTPLNAVIGYTALLAESEALDPALRRHAELARSAGAGLLAVVNDILEFSKIEAGQVEIQARPFAARPLFEDCLSIVRGEAEGKGVDVGFSCDPAIPDWLVGDEGRLRQVLLNLLNNAVKFTDAGSVTLGVVREGKGEGGETLLFTVSDTGIGIPHDRVDRLFQRFSQVDGSISRGYGGTGLGLAICKGLVEAMGGEIGVTSKPGLGSSFWFRIDLARGEAPGAIPAVPNVRRISGRLLLVEDVEINQELARLVLEMAGHEVEVVSDGPSAVEAVRAGGFDLVLMDVQMPGMDGMAATRLIRSLEEDERDVPIVAMTANVLPDEVASFRAAGMDDHVGKPVDRETLYATVDRWLRDGGKARANGNAANS
jgi:PAS domain S-box-containing protein